jgi:hypothetical protein
MGKLKLVSGHGTGKISRPEPLLFLFSSSTVLIEAERTPFQPHYFSEYLVAPGIEPGTMTTRP